MKQSRYTDSQILAILKQAEAGTPVTELCREHGMSNASFYSKKCTPRKSSNAKLLGRQSKKSGEAISTKRDGAACLQRAQSKHSYFL